MAKTTHKKAKARAASSRKKTDAAAAGNKIRPATATSTTAGSGQHAAPAGVQALIDPDAPIDKVSIRMYCLGTGDCFLIRFYHEETLKFTMMIDCGSCRGNPKAFRPYVQHLANEVRNNIDLLVITHEHNDHVNGFYKCADIFAQMTIGEAWFAWTEDRDDPTGAAKELLQKRSGMRKALDKAIKSIKASNRKLSGKLNSEFYARDMMLNNGSYLNGLHTLARINLDGYDTDEKAAAPTANKPPAGTQAAPEPENSLPGMTAIKKILKDKGVKVRYLTPGDSRQIERATGIKFHILGPPMERAYVFKNGKEGVDVYKKKLALYESSLAANAFLNMDNTTMSDCPFQPQFVVSGNTKNTPCQQVIDAYEHRNNNWRRIDDDWLMSAGSLALRLNSHINNTSLALAIEMPGKQVLLFPGDAEYGSWASWHEIEKWKPKKAGEKHFVEDLLNRTVFYKVGHHLSYNGTALQKGIAMMESEQLAAMATLDLDRISEGWKKTMPNQFLMQELIRKCKGKFFLMNETGVDNAPTHTYPIAALKEGIYSVEHFDQTENPIFHQYNCRIK